MTSLLVPVRTKMALHVPRRVRGLLVGEYTSVHKGRSMDFDDLREYIRGDDVKDVDWKASARSGSILLKRYVAVRKHNVLLVVDTGRSMAARAAGGDAKRNITVLAAGVLGSIATQHGDLVGMIASDSDGVLRAPQRESDAHLEQILRRLHGRIDPDGARSNLVGLLAAVRRSIVRRMTLLVVTDGAPLTDEVLAVVRRLRVQHEILWLTITDTVCTDPLLAADDLVDVGGGGRLPSSLRDDERRARVLAGRGHVRVPTPGPSRRSLVTAVWPAPIAVRSCRWPGRRSCWPSPRSCWRRGPCAARAWCRRSRTGTSCCAWTCRARWLFRETFAKRDIDPLEGTLEGDGSSLVPDGIASSALGFPADTAGRSRSMVVATDNEIEGSTLLAMPEVATLVTDRQVRVHAIFPLFSFEDPDRREAAEMRNLANDSGGAFHRLEDTDATARIIAQIERTEVARLEAQPQLVEYAAPERWIALAALALGVLLVAARRARL